MRKSILLIIIIFTAAILLANDIVIHTEKRFGNGPFTQFWTQETAIDTSSQWKNIAVEVSGLPSNWKQMTTMSIHTDFFQFTYQSFVEGKLDEKWFDFVKSAWTWNPTSSDYSSNPVNGGIELVVGYDSNDNLRIIVDQNNNQDLSDDSLLTIPPVVNDQPWAERTLSTPEVEVIYDYFNGSRIVTDTTTVKIDLWASMYGEQSQKTQPMALAVLFKEYHVGSFALGNQNYKIALKGSNPVIRQNYRVKVFPEDLDSIGISELFAVRQGEIIEIDGNPKLPIVSLKGDLIRLGDPSSSELLNQMGYQASNFGATSIEGDFINLEAFRGRYLYLDFWGTWCAPCRAEIPELITVYNDFHGENFTILGIADDNLNRLQDYVAKESIPWPQILQDSDKRIIDQYGVKQYPTTYLISPDGVVLEKNLRSKKLREHLTKVLNTKE